MPARLATELAARRTTQQLTRRQRQRINAQLRKLARLIAGIT